MISDKRDVQESGGELEVEQAQLASSEMAGHSVPPTNITSRQPSADRRADCRRGRRRGNDEKVRRICREDDERREDDNKRIPFCAAARTLRVRCEMPAGHWHCDHADHPETTQGIGIGCDGES